MARVGVERAPLRIVVRDTGGSVVADASVTIAASSVTVPEIALLSDAQGIVRMSLPRGHYEFQAIGPDGRQGRVSLDTDGRRAVSADIVVDQQSR